MATLEGPRRRPMSLLHHLQPGNTGCGALQKSSLNGGVAV
jgi:hypothetical protein